MLQKLQLLVVTYIGVEWTRVESSRHLVNLGKMGMVRKLLLLDHFMFVPQVQEELLVVAFHNFEKDDWANHNQSINQSVGGGPS